MDHGKKKSSGARETSKKGTPPGLAIALAAVGGVIVGSAGTYFFSRPPVAPPTAAPAANGTPQAQTLTVPAMPAPAFTPAPQPPGEVPPGKVWSPEHGHWHDAPGALTIPSPAPVTTEVAPAPTPAPVTPPATPPLEKKE